MTGDDDDHQRRVARRMIAALHDRLGVEHVALALRLMRAPTRAEFAEHVRERFRSDLAFREQVMTAAACAEAEEMEAWARERFAPAPIEEDAQGG